MANIIEDDDIDDKQIYQIDDTCPVGVGVGGVGGVGGGSIGSSIDMGGIDDMGVPIEPFNMKKEMSMGSFDEGGSYILNKNDDNDQTDSWLKSLDEGNKDTTFKDDEMRRRALSLLEKEPEAAPSIDPKEALTELASYVNASETPIECLRRVKEGRKHLGGFQIRKPKKIKTYEQGKKTEGHTMSNEDTHIFNRITELCDNLMAIGHNVYFHKGEDILQTSRGLSQCLDKGDKPKRVEEIFWEYRLPDGNVFGPYPSSQMQQWQQKGFFSDTTTTVNFRQVTETGDAIDDLWRVCDDVDFSVNTLNDMDIIREEEREEAASELLERLRTGEEALTDNHVLEKLSAHSIK
eukprot:GHVR01002973.1.p1 GENE.GHVR01002973.1~~GHVR01002973.1.p1  ORF type:complete len:384 (+),score=120.89 GHVR01002973.1:107-1153(+)